MSTVAGGTTVVDGSVSDSKETYLREKKAQGSPQLPPNSKPQLFQEPELNVDRPFFVKIGKDGLIAALQKLDLQLRNVSQPFFLE